MNPVGFISWYKRNMVCHLPNDTCYATLPFLTPLFKGVLMPIEEIVIASETLPAGRQGSHLTLFDGIATPACRNT
jgi:hypothetical protein